MAINVQIVGAEELAANLSDQQQMRIAKIKTLLEAVQLLEDAARALAPAKSGRLRKSIKGYVYSSGERGYVRAGAKHAHLVEYGTRGHEIAVRRRRRRGTPRRALKLPGGVLRRSAQHPGAKATPYMHPALDDNLGQVERILAKHGNDLMVRIARVR